MIDPITDNDLQAYIDDQLDINRRIEVEDYLASNAEVAARVMADLRTRDALRVILGRPQSRPQMRTIEAARRLNQAFGRQRLFATLRRAASVVVLVGAGWIAHDHIGLGITESDAASKPPAFVEDAVHSHQTMLVRARMASQLEVRDYDPAEMLAETGVVLPTVPTDWQVRDVQVFPARAGQSIEISFNARGLGVVSLYSARAGTFGVIAPTVARLQNSHSVYWQTGDLVYALTGDGPEEPLERAAKRLSDHLR